MHAHHDEKDELQLILSARVDDLNGGRREQVLGAQEKELGRLMKSYGNFERTGVIRERDAKTFEIWTPLQRCMRNMRPLSREKYVMAQGDESASTDAHAAYMFPVEPGEIPCPPG